MDALTIRTSPVLLCCFLSLFLNQLTFFCLAERGRVADFLLQHNYHLTALEFHQELVLEGNAVSGHTPRTKCNLTVSPVLVALLTRRRGCLGWQAEAGGPSRGLWTNFTGILLAGKFELITWHFA